MKSRYETWDTLDDVAIAKYIINILTNIRLLLMSDQTDTGI